MVVTHCFLADNIPLFENLFQDSLCLSASFFEVGVHCLAMGEVKVSLNITWTCCMITQKPYCFFCSFSKKEDSFILYRFNTLTMSCIIFPVAYSSCSSLKG